MFSEKKDRHMISIYLEKHMTRCLEAYTVGLGDTVATKGYIDVVNMQVLPLGETSYCPTTVGLHQGLL